MSRTKRSKNGEGKSTTQGGSTDREPVKSDTRKRKPTAEKNGKKYRGKGAVSNFVEAKIKTRKAARARLKNGAKRDEVVVLKSRTLKQRIRDTQRILSLEGLPETVRLTKQRVLQTLQRELEEDRTRGKDTMKEQKKMKLKANVDKCTAKKIRKEQKKMKLKANVQFFEKRKSTRRLKQSIKSFYDVTSEAERLEFFNFIKTQRGDLNYVYHFPDGGHYISLFPGTQTTSEAALKKRETLWSVISERVQDGELEDMTEKFLEIIIQRTITTSQLAMEDTSRKVPHFPSFVAEAISYLSPAEIEEYASKPLSDKHSKLERAKINARMGSVTKPMTDKEAVSTDSRQDVTSMEESTGNIAGCISSEVQRTDITKRGKEKRADSSKTTKAVRSKPVKLKTASSSEKAASKLKSAPASNGLRRSARINKPKSAVGRYVAAVDQEGDNEDGPAIKMDDDFFLPSH